MLAFELALRKIWSMILTGDSTLWAAIFSIIGALLAGALTGILAVWATRVGARQAHKDAVSRDTDARNAHIVATVQALRAEVDAMWHLVEKQIAPAIATIRTNKPLDSKFVV